MCNNTIIQSKYNSFSIDKNDHINNIEKEGLRETLDK